jgi:hypothetical protein
LGMPWSKAWSGAPPGLSWERLGSSTRERTRRPAAATAVTISPRVQRRQVTGPICAARSGGRCWRRGRAPWIPNLALPGGLPTPGIPWARYV